MKTAFIALRALAVAVVFVALSIWGALGVRRYDAEIAVGFPAWVAALGVLVGLGGAALALLCIGTFVARGRGTPAPFDPPRAFVATGPYRYARNPMYAGGFAALVGFASYQGSISMFLFSFAWLLFFHLFVLLYEEPTLRQKFGQPYEHYLKTVPRWMPRLRDA